VEISRRALKRGAGKTTLERLSLNQVRGGTKKDLKRKPIWPNILTPWHGEKFRGKGETKDGKRGRTLASVDRNGVLWLEDQKNVVGEDDPGHYRKKREKTGSGTAAKKRPFSKLTAAFRRGPRTAKTGDALVENDQGKTRGLWQTGPYRCA